MLRKTFKLLNDLRRLPTLLENVANAANAASASQAPASFTPSVNDPNRAPNPFYRVTVSHLSAFMGLSERAKAALDDMSRDEGFSGNADPSILSLIDALISGNAKTRVLQLGTLVGFSTVFVAGALQRVSNVTGSSVRLDTVDCDAPKQARAARYVNAAGFGDIVRFHDGFSTDQKIIDRLRDETYDVIFIDSSHNYSQTLIEIDIYWPKVRPGGYMLFHDAGSVAANYDPQKEGGVRKALDEWLAKRPTDLHSHMLLEPPYWANPCGAFWAVKAAPTAVS
ncbi:class I SAM-dependent methyltransferase [Hyalangium versicolor]|uniref:class I SAM-dependent methyltransferase n=1 Tax=Hyalangium versicolor TaxID=2861190 RepID=UPI001CCA82F2|nr:class I SAM-dependent methyltransferase [Hyalangium versicolor]